ncbi:MAG: DUF1361 domain-containing protein [Sandaracinus sp.]
MIGGATHLVWNLFLAALAVVLAQGLAVALRVHRARGDQVLAVPVLGLGIAWLLFLPNTCYLFTEVRHFFDAMDDGDLWARSDVSHAARATLAFRATIAAAYVASGALSFGLSIRIVRASAEAAGWRVAPLAPVLFFVVALGVHLGLFARFNSWDVATRPIHVVHHALRVLSGPRRLALLGGVATLLWLTYGVVDVWIDGALLRGASLRTRLARVLA